jgi:type II pantothenate kinase
MTKKVVIGIDVGGSTTKIVGFDTDKNLIEPIFVRASDQITSIYGAFGKFTANNHLELSDIERVIMTGVGSSFISTPIYGLPCESRPEFECVGRGGLYLSGLDNAIVASLGTGTALVHAKAPDELTYLGGTGVGGGTLMGLSKQLLGMDNIDHIVELAKDGDLNHVDLRIRDMTRKNVIPGMPADLTTSNFGKLSDIATKADIALGILNLVIETIGMMAIFSARTQDIRDIVLTGNLTTVPQAHTLFKNMENMFHYNFIIPERAQFGPVIGAALSAF